MKKIIKGLGIFLITILAIYILGPTPDKPQLDTDLPLINIGLESLEQEILKKEALVPNIKPGNQSQIVWNDEENKTKTEYAVVYLHGFSASPEEGRPLHKDFAKRYGYNLYIPRLAEHGIKSENALLNFSPNKYLTTAREAIAIGLQLGEKVIVMSCSTGSTAALYLASEIKDIHSLILYSPNIDLFNPMSDLLTKPWGLQLLRVINGGDYYNWKGSEEVQKYWHTTYRIEAIIQLKVLLQQTMKKEVFSKINQPVFTGYYYKNEDEQDKVVSVKRMKEMFEQLGTPKNKKKLISFPLAGTHAIQSDFTSKDIEGVKRETFRFAENVLGLKPL